MKSSLNPEEIKAAKAKGFSLIADGEHYVVRFAGGAGSFTAAQFVALSELANKFGTGTLYPTNHLSVEIPGIAPDKVDEVIAFADAHDLTRPAMGPHVRAVVPCKGAYCQFSKYNTEEFAAEVNEHFYADGAPDALPNKIKVAMNGCPINCSRSTANDIGIEGRVVMVDGEKKTLFRMYVGGRGGSKVVVGTPLPRLVERDEVIPMMEKIIEWYKANAKKGERIAATLARTGHAALFKELGFEVEE